MTDEFDNLMTWTVMFVDMVDSTEVKVRYAPQIKAISRRLVDLFEIVRDETSRRAFEAHETEPITLRFNGDGAMLLYRGTEDGARAAINAAKRIQRKLEAENLAYVEPKLQMHIRIGIASGECVGIRMGERIEPIGRPADLAARLCAESDPDNIMIDEATKDLAQLDAEKDCIFVSRRLALKGIGDPEKGPQRFYSVTPGHLVRPVQSQLFENGLLKLYTDRPALAQEMSPRRILEYTAPGSELLISGRTLAAWITDANLDSLRKTIVEKGLRVKMILLRPDVPPYLPDEEMSAHYSDLDRARSVLGRLSVEIEQTGKGSLEVRQTDTVIFDGTTCFTAVLAGRSPRHRLMVLQDINASSFDGKACLLLACACSPSASGRGCIADGLLRRTHRVFLRAEVLDVAPVSPAR